MSDIENCIPADVSNNVDTETKFYYGFTDTTFKEGYKKIFQT